MDTFPVFTGYIVLGFGFGLIVNANGFGIWMSLAMSAFIYAGSMQYAAVGLIAEGASLPALALTALMVNARHIFYGISMLDRYKNTGKIKPYLIFALTDETYSLVCTDKEFADSEEKKRYYLWVSLLNHIYWIVGSALGALAGQALNFNSEGIEFALTALFLTIFTEQWISAKNHAPALTGVAASVLCLCLFGKETFLIPSMTAIAAVLCLGKGDKKV